MTDIDPRVQKLADDLYGTEENTGDIDILYDRIHRILDLLLQKGIINQDEYAKVKEE